MINHIIDYGILGSLCILQNYYYLTKLLGDGIPNEFWDELPTLTFGD